MHYSFDTVSALLRVEGNALPVSGKAHLKGQSYEGKGTVKKVGSSFLFELIFTSTRPDLPSGIQESNLEDCFMGSISEDLEIVAAHFHSTGNLEDTWSRIDGKRLSTQKFTSGTIQLCIRPQPELRQFMDIFDAIGGDEEFAVKTKAPEPQKVPESIDELKGSRRANGVWIEAILPNYDLIQANTDTVVTTKNDFLGEIETTSCDTYIGTIGDAKFGLRKKHVDRSDLEVYVFMPKRVLVEDDIKECEKFLQSFLESIAFATGKHAWPYRVSIWKNGALRLDRIKANCEPPETLVGAFSENQGFRARFKQTTWTFESYLKVATTFFNNENEMTQVVEEVTWVIREAAGKSLPDKIVLTTLCASLESLIEVACKFYKKDLNKFVDDEKKNAFQATKQQALEILAQHLDTTTPEYKRLNSIVFNAGFLRPEDRFKLLCRHLNLPWDGLMSGAWKQWKDIRHKIVHDMFGRKLSAEEYFKPYGSIAARINILVLAIMGYKGEVRTSIISTDYDAKIGDPLPQ